jgi:hypothetical protein
MGSGYSLRVVEGGMVFSRLLLATTDSKNYIVGEKNVDKVFVQTEAGEVALCFQIDDKKRQVSHILDLSDNDQRCDGLIFYAKDGEEQKVICLLEMKSTNIDTVAAQIKATKKLVEKMLRQECGSHCNKLLSKITWKAGFYSYGSSDSRKMRKIHDDLEKVGFHAIQDFDRRRADATHFLRGEKTATNNSKKKLKNR